MLNKNEQQDFVKGLVALVNLCSVASDLFELQLSFNCLNYKELKHLRDFYQLCCESRVNLPEFHSWIEEHEDWTDDKWEEYTNTQQYYEDYIPLDDWILKYLHAATNLNFSIDIDTFRQGSRTSGFSIDLSYSL